MARPDSISPLKKGEKVLFRGKRRHPGAGRHLRLSRCAYTAGRKASARADRSCRRGVWRVCAVRHPDDGCALPPPQRCYRSCLCRRPSGGRPSRRGNSRYGLRRHPGQYDHPTPGRSEIKRPPCVKGAPQSGGGLIQPLRQKSKIFATSPYTGEAFIWSPTAFPTQ